MLSWPAPLLPTLPGTGPVLRLHDTARGDVVDTSPGRKSSLTLPVVGASTIVP